MTHGDSTLFASYLDAYMSSPEKQAKVSPSSPASTTRYASMNHSPMTFPQQRSLSQPIGTMCRGVPTTPSRKNVENLDTQYENDKTSFDKRANTYRRLAGEKYHHNKPLNSILTLWEEGHIADRGRGRVAGEVDKGLFDPILSHFKIAPAGGGVKKQRPVSAPHTRASGASPASSSSVPSSPSQAHKVVQRDMGRYNPLTHAYHADNPPSPSHAARKIKEFDRANGGPTLGLAARVDARGSFNPISGDWKEVQSSPAAGAAAASTPTPGSPVSTPTKNSSSAAPGGGGGRGVAHGRAASAPHQRATGGSTPRSPSRQRQLAGESWGTYNPIQHSWSVPPKDERHRDQNSAHNKQHGISGSHYAYTPVPATQGVYNPILNSWTVPPADVRVREGLTFQPATLFSRPTAGTIRVK